MNLVLKKTKEISKNPFIYKSAGFKELKVTSVRNFSIYFDTNNTQIIIYAFWDDRQNPDKLLEILKTNL